jgi:hypothetical protein
VETSAQKIDGDFQCGFFFNQAEDAFLNVKNYNFSLNVVQDVLDADVAIVAASAVAIAGGIVGPGGLLAGLGIGLADFLANAGDRIVVNGTTHRICYCNEAVPAGATYDATGKYTLSVSANTFYWINFGINDSSFDNGTQKVLMPRRILAQGNQIVLHGTPSKPVGFSVVTRGFRDIYAANLCLVMIDWGAVVRQQVGTKQSIGDTLYYPKVTLLFWCGGYFLATNGLYLSGAGTVDGFYDLTNSFGDITCNIVTAAAQPPVGMPSIYGNIAPNERYDNIRWSVAQQSGVILETSYKYEVTFTGITFDEMAPNASPTMGADAVQGVFLGAQAMPYEVSADLKTLTMYVPFEPNDYVTFRGLKGDAFSTRTII